MENASKALLMAGSMLIAIMIIGALVLMGNNLSSYQDSTINNDKEAQIVEFNSQYETYNRPDIRGSDMYSLLNKVIDYNKRKSVVGTGVNDEGQTIGFEAMSISVQFPNDDKIKDNWTFDGTIRLFKSPVISKKAGLNIIEINKSTSNTFETKLKEGINGLEGKYGGQVGVTNLAAGISNLFPSVKNGETIEKSENLYFRNTGNKESITNITNINGTIYKDVCTYYEYIQFKRAYFNCKQVKYNDNTGRIIEMIFEYNPDKIE